MSLQLVFLLQMLAQALLLCAVVIALHDLVETTLRLDGTLAICATVLGLGTLGYLAFWLAYANYPAFSVVKIVVLAALLLRFAVVAWRGRLAACWAHLQEPLLFTTLFAIVVLTLGFANGGLDVPFEVARNRISHALPVDNEIPYILAEALKRGHIASPLYGDWLSSDRPPLQAGLYLLLTFKASSLGFEIVAALSQATFLIGVWVLGVAAGLKTAVRRLVLLACCLLPVTILNTLYTWPKIIAVGYLLLVFVLLFVHQPDGPRERGIAGVLLGGLTALAMLCHGTSAFVLIGLSVMIVLAWRWPAWRTIGCGLASLLVLYLPWAAYQTFVDPPGNRLLKWHLAGVQDVDPRGFGETLRAAYGSLTWHGYIAGRLENFAALFGRGPQHLRELVLVVFNHDAETGRALRIGDFFNFLPSLHGFAIALIVALAPLPFMTAWPRQRAVALELIGVVVATCIAYCVLLFIPGAAVNHQATYAVHVMATIAIFIVLGLGAPRIALLFVALQTITVGTLYGLMLPYDGAFWPTLALGLVATVALFAYALMPALRPADAATDAR